MNRQWVRAAIAVLVCYLVQSTVLPHLKIGGVLIDLMTITLYGIGYTLGPFTGLTQGALAALIMEVASGNLPGLTSILCVGAAAFGFWTAHRFRFVALAGKRQLESLVRQFGPILCVTAFELVKEAIYIAYFYLNGAEIQPFHVTNALFSGLIVAGLSLLLIPILHNYLTRTPGESFLAKWLRKWNKKRKPKTATPVIESISTPTEGGTDA